MHLGLSWCSYHCSCCYSTESEAGLVSISLLWQLLNCALGQLATHCSSSSCLCSQRMKAAPHLGLGWPWWGSRWAEPSPPNSCRVGSLLQPFSCSQEGGERGHSFRMGPNGLGKWRGECWEFPRLEHPKLWGATLKKNPSGYNSTVCVCASVCLSVSLFHSLSVFLSVSLNFY